jgi:hypothetical protein
MTVISYANGLGIVADMHNITLKSSLHAVYEVKTYIHVASCLFILSSYPYRSNVILTNMLHENHIEPLSDSWNFFFLFATASRPAAGLTQYLSNGCMG